jgi:hypothetical protein
MGKRKIWLATVSGAWLTFWFWAFSFAYSDSYFEYDPRSRIPVFATALLGAMAVAGSGYFAWTRQPTLLRALGLHGCGVAIGLAPLALTSLVLSRAPGRWHLEADDAMGAGIDFSILVGLSLASSVGLVTCWAIRAAARRKGITRQNG